MKKNTTKRKKHYKRRSIYQLKRKRRLSRKYNELEQVDDSLYKSNVFIDVTAPEKFKLQYEYCSEVLRFIARIKRVANAGFNINIHLENVTLIGEGAIAMLLSVMEDIVSKKRIIVHGLKPKNIVARDILEKSGFFNYVSGDVKLKNKNTRNTILRTGSKNTPQTLLSKEIKYAMETVWGYKGRNPILYSAAVEMMRNSCDHAFKHDHSIKWHFAIVHDEQNNKVKFSFVDNGKGIIKTFKTGSLKKFINLFKNESDVLQTAFMNGIESRTGLQWRGLGLPTIYEAYDDGYIKNLLIISNSAFIHFDNNIIEDLTVEFSGSYYYWEVDLNCIKACFK